MMLQIWYHKGWLKILELEYLENRTEAEKKSEPGP